MSPESPRPRIASQLRGKEGLGVVVPGRGKYLADRPDLDRATEVHDDDPIGHGLHQIQVMANEDERQVAVAFERYQQIENSAWIDMSRLLRGSSAMMRRGRTAIARAIATRCCWPPDSW